MSPEHEHKRDHTRPAGGSDYARAFALAVGLNAVFVLAEAVAGIVANSLALLADAGHNLSDILGLLLAWWASHLSRRRPSAQRTYGLRRSTVLAALMNAVLLMIAVGGITWEAVRRFGEPEPTASAIVMWVAAAGILINGATAWLFMSGRKRDLNIRAAFQHMAADAAVSLGVLLAGAGMLATNWLWIDPAISIAIAAVIAAGTWQLLGESLNLAMDAVPDGIDAASVQAYLRGLPGITEVHDLHIWGMSTTEVALSAHLVKPDARLDDGLLVRIAAELQHRYGIGHAAIQFEHGDPMHPCALAPEDVV